MQDIGHIKLNGKENKMYGMNKGKMAKKKVAKKKVTKKKIVKKGRK